jgi:hypothetical protein
VRSFFISGTFPGAHDQRDWNRIDVRSKFVNKSYGILGDGGFFFNRVTDNYSIIGLKPYKRPKGGTLSDQQKVYNKQRSQYRVIVENSISQLKRWRVFKSIFRHHSSIKIMKINFNHVVLIVAMFVNMKIEKTPLRKNDWKPST